MSGLDFFKNIYEDLVFSRQFLKLGRIFHLTKIFPRELILEETDKCLLLAPHPDDETMGCGGLLLKYPEKFDIICLTDGQHGGYDKSEDLMSIRLTEFETVMQKLDISSYSLLGIEDRELINNYEIFRSINISKYDYIFLPNYYDQHKDHKATTILLQKLLRRKEYKPKLKIAFYEVWAALAAVNYFVNITEVMDEKRNLINLYKSQIRHVSFEEGIVGLNRYRGILSNRQYSETFGIIDVGSFMKL